MTPYGTKSSVDAVNFKAFVEGCRCSTCVRFRDALVRAEEVRMYPKGVRQTEINLAWALEALEQWASRRVWAEEK